jgi:tRNA pseudouridine32 synthase / 23S rRNA pseudouridine746 synthase
MKHAPDFLLSRLLHRDAMMLVIDKPAGIPVHAGTGGGENLEHYFDALRFGLPRLPSLAHRLDRDTSGCLILGRHRQALAQLGKLFAGNRIEKTYWAVVEGAPPERTGTINLPLGRLSEQRSRWHMRVDHETGQEAITDYEVLGSNDGLSFLAMKPRTGRTHQLRVHCQAIGCPILGDSIYGGESAESFGLHLHARELVIPFNPKKPAIRVIAPVPEHMRKLLTQCGYSEPATDVQNAGESVSES